MIFQDIFVQFYHALITFLPALVAAIVVFLFSLYAAAWVTKLLRKSLQARRVRPELTILLTRLLHWGLVILGAVWALQTVGFNITAFVAGLGITGLVLGFALQDISRNFTAGALLMLQEPFSLGDYIAVAGFEGRVIDIEMRSTELLGPDGLRVIIPNADVFTNAITNYTKISQRRVSLTLGVAYDSDLQQVTEVALQAIADVPGLLNTPEPMLFFHGFGDSAINFTIRFWFDTSANNIFAAQDSGVKAIKQAFEGAGIEIPYPIHTIRMAAPPARA
jgi:small-conductance mechanosensitive channel